MVNGNYSLESCNVNHLSFGVGAKGQHTLPAGVSGRTEQSSGDDPRGSLWNGYNIANWKGAPVYQPGERELDVSI